MPTTEEIAAELTDDPLDLGYAARVQTGDHAGIANLLNLKAYRGPIPIEVLSSYCITEGIVGAVEAIANEPTSVAIPLELKGLCRNVLTLVRDDYRLTAVDLDLPRFGQSCDALVAAGLMTAPQKAAILALGNNRASRAEVLWGPGVVVGHLRIAAALNEGN